MSNLGRMIKGGLKAVDEIQQGVRERSVPSSTPEQADEMIDAAQHPGPADPNDYRPEVDQGRTNIPGPEGRNISMIRLDTTEQINSIIDQASMQNDDFMEARRGVITNEETQRASSSFTIEQLLGRKSGESFNASQVTGARRILIDSAERINQVAEFIANGKKNPDGTPVRDQMGNPIVAGDNDRMAFRQMVAQHAAIQAQVAGMTAEAGRALQAFRINAKGGMLDAQELSDAMLNSGGAKAADKLAALILEQGGDPARISKAVRETYHANTGDMFIEYWLNGLLSGLQTDAANVLGNTVVAAMAVPERFVAAGFSQAMRSPDGYRAGEAAAQLFGLVRGFESALKMGWQTLKTGEPSDALSKIEAQKYRAISSENVSQALVEGMPGKALSRVGLDPNILRASGPWAKGIDLLGHIVRLPGRMLSSEDEFFKAINYSMELEATAYRNSINAGLDGEQFAAAYRESINNPKAEVAKRAQDTARWNTFTSNLTSDSGQALQRLANSHPALKMLLPFVRTPTNILKYVGVRSPLAPLSPAVRKDIMSGDPMRRDAALAKVTLGSMIMGSFGVMALSGNISGRGPQPKDRGVREAMMRKGWQPYSVRVGNEWYSFNRADPIGMTIGLMADMADIVRYKGTDAEVDEVMSGIAMAIAENVSSKTYMRGISEFLTTFNSGDPNKWERYKNRMVGTFIPYTSAVAATARQMDPKLREAWTMIDHVKSRIPGLSDDLPPRRNLWGEEIVLQGSWGADFISPIYNSKDTYSKVDNEIIDNQMDIRMPRRSFGAGEHAVEMTAKQYSRLVELAGGTPYKEMENKTLKQYLEYVVMKSPEYINGTPGHDGMKAHMFKGAVNAYRQLAKRALAKEFTGISDGLKQQQKERQERMQGGQVEAPGESSGGIFEAQRY